MKTYSYANFDVVKCTGCKKREFVQYPTKEIVEENNLKFRIVHLQCPWCDKLETVQVKLLGQ